MKLIEDICSSLAGNAKTRINDPFIGTFICSWIVCNWKYLSLLFWGEGKATERIDFFYNYLSETPTLGWNYVFVIPFFLALFYLFAFPWVSLLINFCQHWVNEKLHEQAVDVELIKITQQKELNKEKLRANPDKQFLEQLVQHDMDRRHEILKHIIQRTARLEEKALQEKEKSKEQEAKTQEAESKASTSKLDFDKKNKQAELEKIRFESNSAKARAIRASHRFPSAYFLMLKIEDSLRNDNIKISLATLGDTVAALFGYENFEALLNDEDFNNETFENVKYIYYDEELAKRLEQIVLDENSDNEDFSADMIFGHLEMLFEDEPFKLITGNNLAEKCKAIFENDPYDIFHQDGTSGAIAESDTIFEYVEDINIEHFDFNDGFYVELSANASGHHRREEDISGRTMSVSIKMHCDLLVGKYGLASIKQGEITGTLDDYD